jgi:hypothetical protein
MPFEPTAKSPEWLLEIVTSAAVTVRVAAVVVAVPTEFVKTAWYLFPFCENAAVNVSVVEVALATLVNAAPLTLTCHCTVGAGVPLAAAVKVTLLPTLTV